MLTLIELGHMLGLTLLGTLHVISFNTTFLKVRLQVGTRKWQS